LLFTEPRFFALLSISVLLYYASRTSFQQLVVIAFSSVIFYGASNSDLVPLLLISTSINAIVSYSLTHVEGCVRARNILISGVVFNLALLLYYKYALMLVSALHYVLPKHYGGALQSAASIPLPIGISFYTFEGISLIVDTYNKRKNFENEAHRRPSSQPWEHFLTTLVFISFFPHLVSGPILKAGAFIPQIKLKNLACVKFSRVSRLLISGYFLKMCVADNLKDYTFWIAYPYFLDVGSATNAVMIFGYSVQIFADFCGYSLIALGFGGLFGYSLPHNFNYPYISSSLSEFWRRWHISLSNWLRDYLYIPLGGNRYGEMRARINILIVMLIGGAWHGAAWSYVVWGAYHGVGLVFERFLRGMVRHFIDVYCSASQIKVIRFISICTIFIYVTIGWVFFKLADFWEALKFCESIMYNIHIKNYMSRIVPVLMLSAPVIAYHLRYLVRRRDVFENRYSHILRQIDEVAFGLMLFLIVTNAGERSAFIYFQF
jgi:alginate O-acetyltransferase complex protein AlgI